MSKEFDNNIFIDKERLLPLKNRLEILVNDKDKQLKKKLILIVKF